MQVGEEARQVKQFSLFTTKLQVCFQCRLFVGVYSLAGTCIQSTVDAVGVYIRVFILTQHLRNLLSCNNKSCNLLSCREKF